MKARILLSAVVCITFHTTLHAAECAISTDECTSWINGNYGGTNTTCANGHSIKSYGFKAGSVPVTVCVISCNSCDTTYYTMLEKTGSGGGTCTYNYTACVCKNGCTSDSWTSSNTGYESAYICDKTCTRVYSHQCAAGYYGTATSASAGCTKCPSNASCTGGNNSTFVCNQGYYKNGSKCERCPASGGVYGTTASAGSTSITSCYLPSGTSFSDSTGSGTYTGNCYYKN